MLSIYKSARAASLTSIPLTSTPLTSTPLISLASPLTRHLATRPPFATTPSPPRLPASEQEIYEKLQSTSTGAFSTPRSAKREPEAAPTSAPAPALSEPITEMEVRATGKGEELHPDVRRGAKPEFEGDKNPRTGEVGGPKNEPLRWGESGDWSYNGRVTDF